MYDRDRGSVDELIQAPEANGIAERFVRTVRSECMRMRDVFRTGAAIRSARVRVPGGDANVNDFCPDAILATDRAAKR